MSYGPEGRNTTTKPKTSQHLSNGTTEVTLCMKFKFYKLHKANQQADIKLQLCTARCCLIAFFSRPNCSNIVAFCCREFYVL